MRKPFKIRIEMAVVVMLVLVTSGATSLSQEQPAAPKYTDTVDPGYEDPISNYDPWEGFNRAMYKFNYGFDKYFFLPVVKAYQFVLPKVVRTGIGTAVDATVETVWATFVVDEIYSSASDRDKLYWGMTGLYYISKRAGIPFRYYGTGSPFEYEYVRYIYLKWRQIEIEK